MKNAIFIGLIAVFSACSSPSGVVSSHTSTNTTETTTTASIPANDSLAFDGKKVEKTAEEWKKLLTPEQYHILREKGTEPSFSSPLYTVKKSGIYCCAGCGLPLFSSQAKFDSGTGWPSFFQPIHPKNIADYSDSSHGMDRTEVVCNRCGGHLGHVFDDGPAPTGLRYCINGLCLKLR